jgi:hypothetical protein
VLSVFVVVRHGVSPQLHPFSTPLFCAATGRRQSKLLWRQEEACQAGLVKGEEGGVKKKISLLTRNRARVIIWL